MTQFILNPSSGYVNSYLDVQFVIQFEQSYKTEITLYNETTKSPIEILGVSNGYIINEHKIVVKNASQIDGYINPFNKDKMNLGLKGFIGVNIKCKIVRYDINNNIASSEEESTIFYNQSQSIDGNIIPFDLNIENNNINAETREPLRLKIECNSVEKYELCIKSEDELHEFTFEVVTKNGQIIIEIPIEILWFDLNAKQKQNYNIYWAKFQGISHLKFMERTHISIDKATFSIKGELKLLPTTRFSPTSNDLPEYFILSHRYLVHTHENWSELALKTKGYNPNKYKNLTLFWHEAQNIEEVEQSVSLMENKTKQDLDIAIWKGFRKRKPFAEKYIQRTTNSISVDLFENNDTKIANKTKQGCGCSRKNK